jgi:hypothetical protein
MKKFAFLLAPFAALAIVFGTAIPAQAATWDGPGWVWRGSTITVSDRNGYDLNENEAAYATGSLSSDDMDMAYTTYQTCDYCIKVYTGSVPGLYSITKTVKPDAYGDNKVWACGITVDVADVGSDWHLRQATVTHAIWHCLGFGDDTPGDSIMNHYNLTYVNAWTPNSLDYQSLDYHYSNAWK